MNNPRFDFTMQTKLTNWSTMANKLSSLLTFSWEADGSHQNCTITRVAAAGVARAETKMVTEANRSGMDWHRSSLCFRKQVLRRSGAGLGRGVRKASGEVEVEVEVEVEDKAASLLPSIVHANDTAGALPVLRRGLLFRQHHWGHSPVGRKRRALGTAADREVSLGMEPSSNELALDVGVPMILDLVVRSPGQSTGYHRPSANIKPVAIFIYPVPSN